MCFDPSDPLGSLLNKNWLASCGGTFRTRLVESEIFSQVEKYHEWTMIAWRLAVYQKKLLYLHELTFEINETESSLSDSTPYIRYSPVGLKRMLAYDIPFASRKKLKQKLSRALHTVAELELREGNYLSALKSHLASMRTLYGLVQYALYTRYFFARRKKPANTLSSGG